jgi:hypothetical protein
MSDEITFDDCCRIILEQGPLDRAYADPTNPDYRHDLLALLNAEFGIHWEDTDEAARRDRRMPGITPGLVRHYQTITDPFAGWLEYAPVEGEMEVFQAHRAAIVDAAAMLRQHCAAYFRDLLLLRWPGAAHRTTSWTRLQEMGLVIPTYDPDDDF